MPRTRLPLALLLLLLLLGLAPSATTRAEEPAPEPPLRLEEDPAPEDPEQPEEPEEPAPDEEEASEAEGVEPVGEAGSWSDLAHLEQVAQQACDAVEVACGAKFEERPSIRITTAEEMTDILRGELGQTFQRVMQVGPSQARAICQALGKMMLAKYEPKRGIIHMLPKNAKTITQQVKRPEVLTKRTLKVLLAHECTHALDFQRFPVLDEARTQRETQAGIQAAGAVLEGHAQFIAERIAAKWGLTKEFEQFTALLTAGAPTEDAATKVMSELVSAQIRFAYVKGHEFFQAVNEAEGREGVERALAHPPGSAREIERPETWLEPDKAERKVNAKTIVEVLKPLLEERSWQARHVELAQAQFEAIFSPLPKEEVEQMMRGFQGGAAMAGTDGFGGMLVLNVDWWADAPAAELRMKMSRRLLEKKDELMAPERAGSVKITESEYQDGAGKDGALEGFLNEKVMQMGTSSQRVSVHVARFGRYVVELTVVKIELERAKQDATLSRAQAAIEAEQALDREGAPQAAQTPGR